VRQAPSLAHWFGSDEVGRDIFSRVVYGTRASLSAGVISVAIAILAGVPLGLLAGYAGGWTDALLIARHRRHAGLPLPDPRHRSRRLPRALADRTP
jgi:ABC-type dipeptide/oligopeptide/nickel transport system permease subunit